MKRDTFQVIKVWGKEKKYKKYKNNWKGEKNYEMLVLVLGDLEVPPFNICEISIVLIQDLVVMYSGHTGPCSSQYRNLCLCLMVECRKCI